MTKEEGAILQSWVLRIFSLLMATGLATTSWFLNQAWDRINQNERDINELKITSATTSGNRFTSGDWMEAKRNLDSDRLALDRRIIRLEESIPTIKDTLLEIKQDVKALHNQ